MVSMDKISGTQRYICNEVFMQCFVELISIWDLREEECALQMQF